MLILVGVTVSFVANGGLITKAKDAGKQTQIAADKELLEFDVILAMGTDGEISFSSFKQSAEADGFTVSGSSLPCTATSKSGNEFSVSADGKVTYIGEGEVPAEDAELELMRAYFVGKSINEFLLESSGSASEFVFKDGTGETAEIKGSDLKGLDTDVESNNNGGVSVLLYVKYLKTNTVYTVVITEDANDDFVAQSVELYTGSLDFNSSGSGSGSGSDTASSSSVDEASVEFGDFKYTVYINSGTASLSGLSEQGRTKNNNGTTTETTALDQVEYNGKYYTVVGVKSNAFKDCTNLALTSLPSGITTIGEYAFSYCTNLALTRLPSGITNIGGHAFELCGNLTLTSLPNGITGIGEGAFMGCNNLALASLPEGLTSIEDETFYSCTNLALSSLPDGITHIGESAFTSCMNLAFTSLPSSVTYIDNYSFYGCTNLALTSLPSGVTSIGNDAFYGCTSIVQLDLRACTNLSTSSENYPWGLNSNQIIF